MILGVIVAGGESRRMGTDKALVEVGGRTMVERVAGAVGELTGNRLVVGREGVLAGIPCLPDDPDLGGGPLAGLVTALRRSRDETALLVGVDQPFLRPETLGHLVQEAEPGLVVVPVAEGIPQVTCAVYPPDCLEEAEAEAEASGSLSTLVERIPARRIGPDRWRGWGEDGRSWFSVDDAQRLSEALRRFE